MTLLIGMKRFGPVALRCVALFLLVATTGAAQTAPSAQPLTPKFSQATAFDVSPPLHTLPPAALRVAPLTSSQEPIEIRPERGPVARDKGHSGDGALQEAGPLPLQARLRRSLLRR